MKTTELNPEELLADIIESAYEDFIKEHELDMTMTLDEILFEMFAAGFEISLELNEE